MPELFFHLYRIFCVKPGVAVPVPLYTLIAVPLAVLVVALLLTWRANVGAKKAALWPAIRTGVLVFIMLVAAYIAAMGMSRGTDRLEHIAGWLMVGAPALAAFTALLVFWKQYRARKPDFAMSDNGSGMLHHILFYVAALILIAGGVCSYQTYKLNELVMPRTNASAEQLREASYDLLLQHNFELLKSLLANPNTPTDVLDRFRYHPDKWTRMILAHHRNSSQELLDFLTRDADPEIATTAWEEMQKRAVHNK